MDLSAGLKSELFRPIVMTIVPGATALAPFVLVAHHHWPALSSYGEAHPTASAVALGLAVIAVGLMLENLGSRIETFWDRLALPQNPQLYDDWYRYLSLTLAPEPIGQRYLRSMTLRLKFELSFGIALLVMLIGLVWHDQLTQLWSRGAIWHFGAAVVVLAGYLLLYESRASVKVLIRLRSELLKGAPPPSEEKATPLL